MESSYNLMSLFLLRDYFTYICRDLHIFNVIYFIEGLHG